MNGWNGLGYGWETWHINDQPLLITFFCFGRPGLHHGGDGGRRDAAIAVVIGVQHHHQNAPPGLVVRGVSSEPRRVDTQEPHLLGVPSLLGEDVREHAHEAVGQDLADVPSVAHGGLEEVPRYTVAGVRPLDAGGIRGRTDGPEEDARFVHVSRV